MKKLKYFYLGNPVTMDHSEANESLAQAEADNGEITIEDDGIKEVHTPTMDERMEMVEHFISKLKSVFPDL